MCEYSSLYRRTRTQCAEYEEKSVRNQLTMERSFLSCFAKEENRTKKISFTSCWKYFKFQRPSYSKVTSSLAPVKETVVFSFIFFCSNDFPPCPPSSKNEMNDHRKSAKYEVVTCDSLSFEVSPVRWAQCMRKKGAKKYYQTCIWRMDGALSRRPDRSIEWKWLFCEMRASEGIEDD